MQLLLTKFEVCSVNYGPSFFHPDLNPSGKVSEKTRLVGYLLYLWVQRDKEDSIKWNGH